MASMETARGRFITLEGGEGAGKSSNMPYLADFLRQRGIAVRMTREPGGTAVGEHIRAVFLEHHELLPETELLLLFAARVQHLHEVVKPALACGEWVLCDRFTDASYAYQGGGRGLEQTRIAYLEQWLQSALRPDLTLLFDIPPAIGAQRTEKRGQSDRFDLEAMNFQQRVRAAYLARAQAEPRRFCVIDAAKPLEAVREALAAAMTSLLAAP